jgi:hypothetical protein
MKEENKRKRRARVLLLLLPRFAVHPLHGGFVTRTVVRQMKKKKLSAQENVNGQKQFPGDRVWYIRL